MRSVEEAAVEAGVTLDRLMENAGRAVAHAVAETLGNAQGSRVVVLVGPGNNGGDGLVAAAYLARQGAAVSAYVLAGDGNPAGKRPGALAAGAGIRTAQDAEGIDELGREAASASVVVDAVLGTGSNRPIAAPLSGALRAVRDSNTPVIAVDLPSGMNADTGRLDPNGLPADTTLFLGNPKIGPVAQAGSGQCGEMRTLDIGIPPSLDSGAKAEWMDREFTSTIMPRRQGSAHKGDFGRALLVAGSRRYPGAALLATRAATRSGAGLVDLAAPESVYQMLAAHVPEAISTALPEGQAGEVHPTQAAQQALHCASVASSMLIGPGFGTSGPAAALARSLAAQAGALPTMVIDADALNILAKTYRWWSELPETTILTPHPGEMARLTGLSTRDVQADRLSAATQAAARWGLHVALKGAATIIASPSGRVSVSPFVNPGLAKGGAGDVLAGLMAGILAQIPDRPFEAASLAVYVHGLAGDIARRSKGEIAMNAGDLIDALPEAFMKLA